jgi:preprotein translocase subunit SecD
MLRRYAFLALVLALSACESARDEGCQSILPSAAPFTIGAADFAGRVIEASVEQSSSGYSELRVKFDAAGTKALEDVTRTQVGSPVPVRLDGEEIASPVVFEPITGGELVLSGSYYPSDLAGFAARLAPACADP